MRNLENFQEDMLKSFIKIPGTIRREEVLPFPTPHPLLPSLHATSYCLEAKTAWKGAQQ